MQEEVGKENASAHGPQTCQDGFDRSLGQAAAKSYSTDVQIEPNDAGSSVCLEMDAMDAAALKRILESLIQEDRHDREPMDANVRRNVGELVFKARKARVGLFPASMFNEPAWDMLVALYVSTSPPAAADLARWTDTPLTTATRWLQYLEAHKFVTRESDPQDRRAFTVRLTDDACAKLDALFEQIAAMLGPSGLEQRQRLS